MKTAALKFLFARGIGPIQEIISKAVRHGLTTFGGYLSAQGLATGDDIATLQGAAVVLVGIALSVARTFVSKFL
jgi:hypothetical protein